MKNIIKSLLIIVLFTSCYTQKVAEKQVIKANVNYPELTSNFCAVTFPVKEKTVEKTKFIKGETITKIDTLTVDCDSIVKNKDIDNKVLIKYRDIFRTDTIVKTKTIEKENTAKITNLELQIKRLESTKTANETTIKDLRKDKYTLWKWLIISLIVNVLLVIVIIKR